MIEGLRAVLGGIGFVLLTPRVWPHTAVPMVMLTVLACGLGGLGVWGANWITGTLTGNPEGVWGQVGSWLLTVLLALAALLAALLLALVLAQPLSGFALDAIVRAQERALLGHITPPASFLAAMLASTRACLVVLVLGGAVQAVLFAINFFFPPAAMVTVPVGFVVSGWLLAWNFLDYPLSQRRLGLFARLRWAWRHVEEFSVFGVCWAALLVVPGMFLLVLPMGVAGATRLVVEAELLDDYDGA
jgi:CysZ protein